MTNFCLVLRKKEWSNHFLCSVRVTSVVTMMCLSINGCELIVLWAFHSGVCELNQFSCWRCYEGASIERRWLSDVWTRRETRLGSVCWLETWPSWETWTSIKSYTWISIKSYTWASQSSFTHWLFGSQTQRDVHTSSMCHGPYQMHFIVNGRTVTCCFPCSITVKQSINQLTKYNAWFVASATTASIGCNISRHDATTALTPIPTTKNRRILKTFGQNALTSSYGLRWELVFR